MRLAVGLLSLCGAMAAYADLAVEDGGLQKIANEGGNNAVLSTVASLNSEDLQIKSNEPASRIDLADDNEKGHNGHHRDHDGGDPLPAVPEPTSVLTFGSGLIALGLYTRRHRRKRTTATSKS